MLAGVPLGRFAEADIAAAIASCPPGRGLINGINLPVDGGRTLVALTTATASPLPCPSTPHRARAAGGVRNARINGSAASRPVRGCHETPDAIARRREAAAARGSIRSPVVGPGFGFGLTERLMPW